MLWIGLTGGIASGKSTVGRILVESGFPVVDADQLARDTLAKDSVGYREVLASFGPEVVRPDGEINRVRLGEIVFADRDKLQLLESIVHPKVRELADLERERLRRAGRAVAFYDVPLLFEKGMAPVFDRVVVVTCTPGQQVRRLMERNHLAEAEARMRIASQINLDEKAKRAEDVIDNSSDLAALRRAVELYLRKIRTLVS